MLINDHEKKHMKLAPKERVYGVFANKNVQNDYLSPFKGANISTSKVAITFAFSVTVTWGVILLINLTPEKPLQEYGGLIFIEILASVAIVLISTGIIPKVFLKSKIDHLEDLEIKQDK